MKSILSNLDGPLWTVCWSPCGGLVACAGSDRTIRIYSVKPPNLQVTLVAELRDAHTKTIRCLDWHRHWLAAASFDGTVSIWSVNPSKPSSFKCVAKLDGHENEVKAVRFSPDGRRIATCGRDRTVWIWSIHDDDDVDDCPEFECEAVLQEHAQDVKCLQWHPSGDILLSGSYDNAVKVFGSPLDGDEWLCLDTLEGGHASTVWGLAWSDDGHLYSVSDDRSLIRWADENGSGNNKFNMSLKPDTRVPDLHDEAIYTIALSPTRIITAGADCQICILDKASMTVLCRHRMTSQVNQVAVQGDLMAAALDSGELLIGRFTD